MKCLHGAFGSKSAGRRSGCGCAVISPIIGRCSPQASMHSQNVVECVLPNRFARVRRASKQGAVSNASFLKRSRKKSKLAEAKFAYASSLDRKSKRLNYST